MEKNNKQLGKVRAIFTKDMLLKIYVIAEDRGIEYTSVDIALDTLEQAEKEISELYKFRDKCGSKYLIGFNSNRIDMSKYEYSEHTLIAIRDLLEDEVKNVHQFVLLMGASYELLLAVTIDTILDAKIQDILLFSFPYENKSGAFFEFDNKLTERSRRLKIWQKKSKG